MKINGQKGAALPLVMIAIVLGALVIPPFLAHADTSIIGSGNYADAIYSQYACDSGAEHGIWSLTNGTLAASLSTAGKSVNYLLPETINGMTANVTVCNSYQIIASDNFDSGTWSGGTGWLDDWTYTDTAAIVSTGTPYEGPYHLRLFGTDIAKRSINLRHEINIHIKVWVKIYSIESGETATCQVSSDGTNWTTVHTWTVDDDDNTYHQYDIDLSPYDMTSQFWISFDANTDGTSDYFYVDKLEVMWLAANPTNIATDDFESGDGTGGAGWLNEWMLSGSATVTALNSPHTGSYHLNLTNSFGIAKRAVNLSDTSIAFLQVWAKVNSLEGGDIATCQISSDNVSWHTVYTWDEDDSDNTYHYYSIDLSSYDLTSCFWISFNAGMNGDDDYFYVDDIVVQKINGYGITVIAGDTVLKAVVRILDGGYISVLSWYYT